MKKATAIIILGLLLSTNANTAAFADIKNLPPICSADFKKLTYTTAKPKDFIPNHEIIDQIINEFSENPKLITKKNYVKYDKKKCSKGKLINPYINKYYKKGIFKINSRYIIELKKWDSNNPLKAAAFSSWACYLGSDRFGNCPESFSGKIEFLIYLLSKEEKIDFQIYRFNKLNYKFVNLKNNFIKNTGNNNKNIVYIGKQAIDVSNIENFDLKNKTSLVTALLNIPSICRQMGRYYLHTGEIELDNNFYNSYYGLISKYPSIIFINNINHEASWHKCTDTFSWAKR